MTISIIIESAVVTLVFVVLSLLVTLLDYEDRKDRKQVDSPTAILIADEVIKIFEKYGYDVECISGQLKDNSKWQIRIKEKKNET